MQRSYFTWMVLIWMAMLSFNIAAKSKDKILQETLQTYAATIRWGDITAAQTFLSPRYREEHPLTSLDIERYHQVQVTHYREQPVQMIDKTEARQSVEIGLVNINTQSVRTVSDRQVWRYDGKTKNWWLESGLPDITHHD